MKRKKILFLINNLNTGGAETFLALLLKHLKEYKDLEIVLFTLTGGGPLESEIKKLGIKYRKFNYHIFVRILNRFDPFIRLRLTYYVWKEKPDLIHGHLFGADLASKILGGILKVPVILTQHDSIITHPGQKQVIFNKYLTKAVAVSGGLKRYLQDSYKVPTEKIMVIPNGLEVEKFKLGEKKFRPKEPVFFYLGRLIPTKGVQFAMKALNKLKEDYPNLKFLIFGDGFYRKDLEHLKSKESMDFVEFRGKIDNNKVPAALAEGDILILPSKTEGFCLAVLEASASKKAIIATRTGAITDMVKDGKTGFFVNYGSEKEIYEAAKKILDQNLVESFGEAAFKNVKDAYSIKKITEMYYNLYKETLYEKSKNQ